MKYLVTGSAGHLGEALMRSLLQKQQDQQASGGDNDSSSKIEVVGVDVLPSPFTTVVGSISDREFVKSVMQGVDVVFNAATLHKPHVATHTRQAFVDVNITGTLNLLEEAAASMNTTNSSLSSAAYRGVGAFVYTSTTSVFGDALEPKAASDPAVWITEDVMPIPKNIYGVTKLAAEDMCALFNRNNGLPCMVLRTSRFFPEDDDEPAAVAEIPDQNNAKANEFLNRRVEIEDVVSAHFAAADKLLAERDYYAAAGAPPRPSKPQLRRYIISAPTPLRCNPTDLAELRRDASAVVARHVPEFVALYKALGWRLPGPERGGIGRVYDSSKAQAELGWKPVYDFRYVVQELSRRWQQQQEQEQGGTNSNSREPLDIASPMARLVGVKGYHRDAAAAAAGAAATPAI